MTHHPTVISGRAHVARASARPFRPHPLALAIAALLASPAVAQVPASFIAQKITGPAGGVVTSFGVTDSSVVGAMQFSQGPIVAWQNRTIGTLAAGTGRGIDGDRDIVGSTSIQTANGRAFVAMRWTPGLNGVAVLSPVRSKWQEASATTAALPI